MYAKLVAFLPSAMLLETLIFLICLAKTFLCLVFLKGMLRIPVHATLTNNNGFTFKGIIAFAFSTFMGIFSIYIIASY
jgi:hypothetical protein